MKHIGMSEAKINLSALVEEVEKGVDVVITRHGRPVAKLVAYEGGISDAIVAKRKQAIAEIREMARRRGLRISIDELKGWIDEGRP
jgi:prevent-host-death family protein